MRIYGSKVTKLKGTQESETRTTYERSATIKNIYQRTNSITHHTHRRSINFWIRTNPKCACAFRMRQTHENSSEQCKQTKIHCGILFGAFATINKQQHWHTLSSASLNFFFIKHILLPTSLCFLRHSLSCSLFYPFSHLYLYTFTVA